MTEFTIRLPEEKDIEQLAQLHFYMWNEFYKDLIPQKYSLKNYKIEQCREIQVEMVNNCKQKPNEHGAWLAEDDHGKLAGICYINANETEGDDLDVEGFDTELQRLYLWPDYRQQGLGTHLFELSKNWLEMNNYQSMCIWTFDENPYGRFYRKHNTYTAKKMIRDYEGTAATLSVLGFKL